MRAFDLIAPLGKGQRCLIVAPPKAGKTTFLMDVAHAVEVNHPEIAVYVLLVDERPEEVTHFRRGVRAEVFAASSDLSTQEHVERAEQAMTTILRRVSAGEDVLLLLDSITRLARAYNAVLDGTGRTLTGGLDAATMQAPRQMFGAARKIEEGGSLTILGTALIDTGSRMDDVIFHEFKGTGNTELVLSRELFEKRIFPCIDIAKSGTRKEEKLVLPDLLPKLHMLRRVLVGKKADEAMSGLLGLLERFPTNEALLRSL
jgi:transcription termination factor Rho